MRSIINKMVKLEQERLIKENISNPLSIVYKTKKLKEFWNITFQYHGLDILDILRKIY